MGPFDERWKNSIFDEEDSCPGADAYFHAGEFDWERIQEHLAFEYEPWDITEGDYWVYIRLECFRNSTSTAMKKLFQKVLEDGRAT